MKMYTDVNYAAARLVGTIARVGGKATKIVGLNKTEVHHSPLRGEGNIEVAKIKDLDITPVPLGYINLGGRAYYTCRSSVRKDWKQGLRNTTLRVLDPGVRLMIDEAVLKELGNTIEDVFPAFKDALKNVAKGLVRSVAFSRDFAIARSETDEGEVKNVLRYKGAYEVGEVSRAGDITLHPNYNWLAESVEGFA